MTYRNASKFAIFLECENPYSFFIIFHFTLFFSIMNDPDYVNIDQGNGHSLGKNKVAQNEKWEKTTYMFATVLFFSKRLDLEIVHVFDTF